MSRTVRVIPAPYSPALLDRLAGILTLDDQAYETIRHDPRATRQALILVVLVDLALAATQLDRPLLWQVASQLLGVLFWVLGAWLLFGIGTRLLNAPAPDGDWLQLVRLSGFVQITFLVDVLQPVEVIGPVLSFLALVWGFVLTVKAVKLVLAIGTGRAIAASCLVCIPLIATALPVYFTFRHWGLA
jgi:hypothetical protein